MSSCNKDFYDNDLLKKCVKCGDISLKKIFHRDKTKTDGFHPQCKVCRRE